MQHRHAGPVIIVDEVCKAAIGHSAKGGRQSIQDAMLGQLEPVSAKEWECPFYRVSFDLSAISWILTSNYLDLVPEPLRTRCDVVECPNLTPTQLMVAAERIGEKASLSPPAIWFYFTCFQTDSRNKPLKPRENMPDKKKRPKIDLSLTGARNLRDLSITSLLSAKGIDAPAHFRPDAPAVEIPGLQSALNPLLQIRTLLVTNVTVLPTARIEAELGPACTTRCDP